MPLKGKNDLCNPEASYWIKMQKAVTPANVIVEEREHLSDLFLEEDIKVILKKLFPSRVTDSCFGSDHWTLDKDLQEFVGDIDVFPKHKKS